MDNAGRDREPWTTTRPIPLSRAWPDRICVGAEAREPGAGTGMTGVRERGAGGACRDGGEAGGTGGGAAVTLTVGLVLEPWSGT
ncbi:hypothetical protein Sme01_45700 [Sphaerisporangium melleum]|uniref:Uncharacterized protein n=1 Tax=Sphaerisporangium melleum TaxID=321316 RepID=A0A917R0K6_9ACTN|nr:hypothetical protein GCM10007964_23380 [Sphaerisporangium melleum]GII72094.1 hypothetical protein Sme01_45700 [Sphaerisporangium melleum]